MDFVDRNRGVKLLPLLPCGHPLLVTPFVTVQIPDDGGRVRTHFRQVSIRVRFEREIAMMPRLDFELVELTLLQPRDEDLPHPRRAARPHGMAPPVPLIEVSDNAHTLGIGRPYGKADASRARMFEDARAKLLIQPEVGALSEQVQIKIRQNWGIAVRIVDFVDLLALAVRGWRGNGKPVMEELRLIVEDGLEEAVLMDPAHGIRLVTAENQDC